MQWNATGLFINHKPFYFKVYFQTVEIFVNWIFMILSIQGFGKHEDSDIRGKGLDLPTVAKDFNLLK